MTMNKTNKQVFQTLCPFVSVLQLFARSKEMCPDLFTMFIPTQFFKREERMQTIRIYSSFCLGKEKMQSRINFPVGLPRCWASVHNSLENQDTQCQIFPSSLTLQMTKLTLSNITQLAQGHTAGSRETINRSSEYPGPLPTHGKQQNIYLEPVLSSLNSKKQEFSLRCLTNFQ